MAQITRLAFVTSHFPPSIGGVARHVSALAEQMARRGIAVDIITPLAPECPDHISAEALGGTIRRFRSFDRGNRYAFSPGLWSYLRRAGSSYDLVHAHNYHALPALLAALSGARALIVTPHYHGSAHSTLGRMLDAPYHRVASVIFEQADAVICVSDAERSLLTRRFRVAAGKSHTIHNGLDLEGLRTARPLSAASKLILTVGRLERYKRVDLILDSLRLLPDEWHLAVIGEGRDRRRLEHRAELAGVNGRVSFVDPVDDALLRRWMKTASVYVSMSTHEAFGLAVAEAMTAGAGIVASDIPPHRELIGLLQPQSFELVSAEGDGPALARAIARSERQRTELALAERLPWERIAAKTLALYEAVVS